MTIANFSPADTPRPIAKAKIASTPATISLVIECRFMVNHSDSIVDPLLLRVLERLDFGANLLALFIGQLIAILGQQVSPGDRGCLSLAAFLQGHNQIDSRCDVIGSKSHRPPIRVARRDEVLKE